jgi:hypothetical protein
MEKSSQKAWKFVPLRHFFPLKVVPLIEVLLYSIFARVTLTLCPKPNPEDRNIPERSVIRTDCSNPRINIECNESPCSLKNYHDHQIHVDAFCMNKRRHQSTSDRTFQIKDVDIDQLLTALLIGNRVNGSPIPA